MDVKNKAIKASMAQLFIRCSKGPYANVNGNHCHFRDEKSSEKAWIFAGFA